MKKILVIIVVICLLLFGISALINSAIDNSVKLIENEESNISFNRSYRPRILYENIRRLDLTSINNNESVYGTEESVFYINDITLEDVDILEDNTSGYYLSNEEIDMVANVVMHEVGGIYGSNAYVTITYANGQSVTYNGSCILHKIHAQVLLNQYNSSMFPSSLASCIRNYWMSGLEYSGYYSGSNSTWQHCRNDVIDILNNGFSIPSNVYGATCDPYFASYYSGYSLYATVYWNTGWHSGTFYYYQYG